MAEGKKTIMIVEDDAFVVDIYRKKLREEGFEIAVASDGAEALEKLQAESAKPDLILLDIIMPQMNGLDLMKKMKADEKLNKIPIILLTNVSQKEDVDTGLELGAKDYLIKSHFTPGEVLSKVKSVLG